MKNDKDPVIPVQPIEGSSNVAAAGYDPMEQILRIQFQNGGTYDYHGVDADLAKAFEDAPSKGKFISDILKPGCPVSKVKEEDKRAG